MIIVTLEHNGQMRRRDDVKLNGKTGQFGRARCVCSTLLMEDCIDDQPGPTRGLGML